MAVNPPSFPVSSLSLGGVASLINATRRQQQVSPIFSAMFNQSLNFAFNKNLQSQRIEA